MAYRTSETTLQPDRSVLVIALHGRVHGIDRGSGEIRWTNDLGGWGSTGHVALAVAYGVVVAAAETGGVFCLEYLTGKTRWNEDTQSSGRATVLIESDHIVCAKVGYIDAYTPQGQRLWQQPLRGAGTGTAALGYPDNVVQADAIGER